MRRGLFEQRLGSERDRLLRYAFALTRDRDEARDLFQETMVRVISAPQVPAAQPAFRAWLFKIVRNLWIDRVRSNKRREVLHQHIAESVSAVAEATVERHLAVRDAFSQLSTEHQEVLAMVDIAGFSYKETGEVLSIPSGTVMSRVARARQRLFELLSAEAAMSENMSENLPERRS